ncbi:MAG: amino acid ABC transporter permease [Candidatus Puniceispirillales bacterium]
MAGSSQSSKKGSAKGYVRTEAAPLLPPPASEAGISGWFYHNIFASMSDFSSPGATITSVLMGIFTVLVAWFGISITWSLIDFAFISAVWSDPEGLKREACWTVEQGGSLPAGWHGACWPFVAAKMKFLIYGPYDSDQLWRVNLAGFIGLVGLVWLLIEKLPYRRIAGVFLLTVYPVIATILLTGGAFETNYTTLMIITVVALGLITVGRLSGRRFFGEFMAQIASLFGISGWLLIAYAVVLATLGVDVGLRPIDTNDWGGLLITLVVAITGIVASLPLGIILALGRRSKMPIARILSVVFIEFWRGVPLITVLFMASVMLPLFMPEGVNFNNLLRALVGVMLFSAAYMAEVVRGGLQAIDKGQFEGADAIGLSYWQSMRLIILPQALTHVIPGIVNTFIGLFKDTTLVSIIGLFDLLGAAQSTLADAAWASPVQSHTGYLFIAVVFFVFCFGMSRYSIFMENKLNRSRKH